MPATPSYLAPFTPCGDLLHYAYAARDAARAAEPGIRNGIDWRRVEPFEARLTIDGMRTGRSAKYLEWLDPDGHRYPMFLKDLIEAIRGAVIQHGTVCGEWIVRKRGENFGIRLADPTENRRAHRPATSGRH